MEDMLKICLKNIICIIPVSALVAQELTTLPVTPLPYLPKVLVYKSRGAGWYSLPLCFDSGISS